MDFKDSIKQISEKIEKVKDSLLTEEATKNALIMPFLSALGYDVFNPFEVQPEMTCDIAMKKGEKIDYAILRDGTPIILIECKHWVQNLTLHDNQLIRYFNVSKAKFGLLTNGIIYKFYTDLAEPNKMDEKPFLEVNLLDLKDAQIEELKKFHKSYFDVDTILSSANELKYMHELRSVIIKEFANPSPDFVRFIGKQVYDGVFNAKALEQFTLLVKRTISSYVSDLISDRLKAAIVKEEASSSEDEIKESGKEESECKIETTEEELQSFYIVKSILKDTIDLSRVTYRDAQRYFAIFLDDNNRKTVCRLYLNSSNTKKLVFLDDNKKEEAVYIETIDDIYKHSQRIIEQTKKLM